ncbi:hypothetical protein K443DRAFT_362041 [Laccaria amethystina LaAM-08-1]|uniref:Uncharacterized protein n=1 Tax=Laccaria amethystina LaAM-08-1 TaxID=1095629 RepID=A0A0C9WZM5_9AGAR|nr:hypothetical protein K443DRAFT_362041 [Laccaria amethystina LaAM-08-1]
MVVMKLSRTSVWTGPGPRRHEDKKPCSILFVRQSSLRRGRKYRGSLQNESVKTAPIVRSCKFGVGESRSNLQALVCANVRYTST